MDRLISVFLVIAIVMALIALGEVLVILTLALRVALQHL